MHQLPPITEMTRAMSRRDTSYDGLFFIAVKTTGIFCRPSCPARKPLPKNIEFFATLQQSLLAGYRPCKRCRPLEADGRPPAWVRQLLDEVDAAPDRRIADAELRSLNIDPARARRYFRKHYGMTFQAYHRAKRLGLALAQLRKGTDMNHIAHKIGYDSPSGFRDAFARTFGEPPGRGRQLETAVAQWIETPLGPMVAAATSAGLCLLEFADRRALENELHVLRKRLGFSIVPGLNEHLEKIRRELADYFDVKNLSRKPNEPRASARAEPQSAYSGIGSKLNHFSVPLVMSGTPFQQNVWNRLLEIPFGRTISYDDLARQVGNPGACRAVGTANGANKIAIVIPCHRVVRKSGELGGYGGGLWRKQFLLDLERGMLNATPVGRRATTARVPHPLRSNGWGTEISAAAPTGAV